MIRRTSARDHVGAPSERYDGLVDADVDHTEPSIALVRHATGSSK